MPMPELPHDLSSFSLAEIARMAAGQKLPPVASWNPAHSGQSDMRIAQDGTWFHEGTPIRRENMVRLFSTILRREGDGRHVLVTPAERLYIEVEDAAFIAVEVKSDGSGPTRTLAFRLNTGDLILASAENGISMRGTSDAPAPYLHVRDGLEARLARPVYYELANLALNEGNEPAGLWSSGAFFPMEPRA